jgi:hypothetical protein
VFELPVPATLAFFGTVERELFKKKKLRVAGIEVQKLRVAGASRLT